MKRLILLPNIILLTPVLLFLTVTGVYAHSGPELRPEDNQRITGTVVDASTGEPLVNASIYVVETGRGTVTNLDGEFRLQMTDPGTYTLQISYISFTTRKITDIVIGTGETYRLDIALQPASSEMDEVIVSAKMLHDIESSLLALRQKSMVVSNAISAEFISRSAGSNAADAMEKVSGASVVDGKYVYIRGLGDRYLSTSLNGSTLPSADPDKNAVPLDLFPASLLSNITTIKSFTPDLPGDFTGGAVNIQTRDYPDRFEFRLSGSGGMNTSVGAGNLLLYDGGRTGLFGNNGGFHRIPDAVMNSEQIPPLSTSFTNEENAMELDRLTKSFSSVMTPKEIKAPFDQSFSASIGNQFDLRNKPLGFIAAFTQSRSTGGYANGETARYQLTSNAETTESLSRQFRLDDQFGKEEVLWGGLLNLAFNPGPNHKIGFNYMINKDVESSGRYLAGEFPRDLPDDGIFETRVLKYVDRTLNSYQLKGEHQLFGDPNGIRLEWNANLSSTEQDEPDLRFFSNDMLVRQRSDGSVDTTYQISPSIYPRPTRYFRNLQENHRSYSGLIEVPLDSFFKTRTRIKIGGNFSEKDRAFREREFQLAQDRYSYNGDPVTFFSEENLGIDEDRSTGAFYRFRNYVIDNTQHRNSYDGDQRITAAFAMMEITLFERLRLSGGVRFESTDIQVVSADSSIEKGSIEEKDLLPSLNVVYELTETMNLRFAYGKTIARPTFREMAPFASFDFVNSNIVVGNPQLERSVVRNYDLRYEWFARPGELYAVSLFYKDFEKPIEKVFNPLAAASNPEIQFRNVNTAKVYGAEFEIRKRLDQVHPLLRHFDTGMNLTLVYSEVNIAEDELQLIRALDPGADDKRELQGQSPYVVNADITYSNQSIGTTLSVFYNLFGPRMSEVSVGGTPNVYEYSRHQLDFTAGQRMFGDFQIRLSVKNILDEEYRKGHEFKGTDYYIQRYRQGRSISLGVSYSF